MDCINNNSGNQADNNDEIDKLIAAVTAELGVTEMDSALDPHELERNGHFTHRFDSY